MTLSSNNNRPSTGFTLAFIGGLSISFDIPLIRLAGADPYMVMGVRGLGLCLVLYLYWRFFADRSNMPKSLLIDRDFLTVGTLSGVNNICFTLAVFNTSTANVVFILAFNALLAALLSWPMTGERPTFATLLAIGATLLGVGIIVADGFSSGNIFGDLLALLCACTLALSLTLTRRSGKDLSLAPAFGGAVSLLFALPMVLAMSKMPDAMGWLMFDAFILVPIAGVTLWLAPRYIPAAHVALFYLLETVLTPIWVWIVFYEVPSTNVFVGGSLVIAALISHSSWELMMNKKRSKNASATINPDLFNQRT